ncbi:MAG: hypothetical protein NC191_03080 [Muribaculaceae bacterium]|nr:hypothetical protein [Muribaculaceae bacterium]
MKILKINGIKGLITTLFVAVCAFQGFVVFPGSVAMNLWNKYLVNLYMFPSLSLFQGVLLWGAFVTVYCILAKTGFAISFEEPNFTEDEIENIVKKARINAQQRLINKSVSKMDRFEISKKDNSDIEIPSYVSSPISLGKQESKEKNEEEKVSELK